MTTILRFLQTILDKLPLKGWKRILGFILFFFADKYGIPMELLNPILEWLGIGLVAIGSAHAMIDKVIGARK